MKFAGLITALVTPFDEEENIDLMSAERLINHLIDEGVEGIFILGTNGEFHTLSENEKLDFTKKVIDIIDKRVPLYVGTGGNSTKEVIDLTLKVHELGADAVSIITPYLLPLSEEELFQHYLTISEAVNIPIVLYNIPKNTGNLLTPEIVAKLSKLDNIVGIKDSSGDIENLKAYIEMTQDSEFSVVSGSDSLILKALEAGATGAVAATSNVITRTIKSIFNAYNDGNIELAKKQQDSIEEFRRILKLATVPSVLKYSLHVAGLSVGKSRKPVLPVEEEHGQEIIKVMDRYNRLESNLEVGK